MQEAQAFGVGLAVAVDVGLRQTGIDPALPLLLVPVMLLGLFILFNLLFPGVLRKEVVSVMLMQAAMPCMVNVVIMVNIMGEDDGTATANVFISTILSIITLPLILMSLSLF